MGLPGHVDSETRAKKFGKICIDEGHHIQVFENALKKCKKKVFE